MPERPDIVGVFIEHSTSKYLRLVFLVFDGTPFVPILWVIESHDLIYEIRVVPT